MDHAFTPSPLVRGSVAEPQAHFRDNHRLGLIQDESMYGPVAEPQAHFLDNHRLGLIQDESMHGPVAELQRLLGYSLNDPRLLVEALTHPSHPSRPTYERLEHLGDAALNLAFTNYLFGKNPTLEPGPLTVLRSANVCTEKLARVAVRHSLYGYLRRNTPVQDQMAEEFTQSVIQEDPAATAAAAFGGTTVKARKVLADIVESIAGAVYIDTDYDLRILWKVMKPLLQPIVTSETFDVHAVTKVTQLCQKLRKHIVFVDSITGDGDNKLNVVGAVVDGMTIAEGYSDQRSIAKLNAAREALLKLQTANTVHEAPATPKGLDVSDKQEVITRSVTQLTLKQITHEVCPAEAGEARVGAKQELHRLCQKKHWQFPIYKLDREEGPAHDKRFVASVLVQTPDADFVMLSGLKQKLKEAENQAALGLLLKLLNI